MNCDKQRTAIILVTYNGWALTEACLKDLEPLLASDDFVIAIADNCSTDNTVENIRIRYPAEKFPGIHVYPQSGNLGFGAANNNAIRSLIADGVEFSNICLLNNDTRFNADFVVKLRKSLAQAQAIAANAGSKDAVVVPETYNADGSRQNNFFAGLGPDGIGFLQFFFNAFRNEAGAARILEGTPKPTAANARTIQPEENDSLLETHWASAVCWMLSRKLWDAAGGFDEKIFMYYEDADLALRLRKLGAQFYIDPSSRITHLGGGSASSSLSRALQHDRSQQYVFRKHFGIRGLLLSKAFRIARSLVRITAAFPRCLAGSNAQKQREYLRHHLALLKESII